jgi:hypothetical protein
LFLHQRIPELAQIRRSYLHLHRPNEANADVAGIGAFGNLPGADFPSLRVVSLRPIKAIVLLTLLISFRSRLT